MLLQVKVSCEAYSLIHERRLNLKAHKASEASPGSRQRRGKWVVLQIRVPFKIPFYRMPY